MDLKVFLRRINFEEAEYCEENPKKIYVEKST